jgi:2-iminobutanoate/2-iminopropanoate deaminase
MESTRAGKEVFFVKEGQQHSSPIPEGVKAGGFIYLSAIRGVDPVTQRVESDDPEEQSRDIFEVVKKTLAAAGATLDDVVKVACFFKNLDDRTAFNKVWSENFGDQPPARFAVEVYDFGGPGDKSKILVDVTALAPN